MKIHIFVLHPANFFSKINYFLYMNTTAPIMDDIYVTVFSASMYLILYSYITKY